MKAQTSSLIGVEADFAYCQADVRFGSKAEILRVSTASPLYPHKRKSFSISDTSALGQKRTSRMQGHDAALCQDRAYSLKIVCHMASRPTLGRGLARPSLSQAVPNEIPNL
jgi:hypothetical protein